MPIESNPEVFGFHPNADITKDINETNLLLNSILLCSSAEATGGEGGKSSENMLEKLISSIMQGFPELFNIEEAMKKYPVKYEESMNTVIT